MNSSNCWAHTTVAPSPSTRTRSPETGQAKSNEGAEDDDSNYDAYPVPELAGDIVPSEIV